MPDLSDKVSEERPLCLACALPIKPGDLVLLDASGDLIHRTCCGPERESFTNSEGDPLRPDDPIPKGWRWYPEVRP